jgi:predicted DNA-binding transcriptional regulator AlpA
MNLPDLTAIVLGTPPEDLPSMIAALEGAKAVAWARLTAPVVNSHAHEDDRLLDMPETADLLGIPEDRAYDLGRQRAFPVVSIGKYKRVRLSAVMKFIAASESQPLAGGGDVTYSRLREGRRGHENSQGARVDAGSVRRTTRRSTEQRGPMGAGRDGASGRWRSA